MRYLVDTNIFIWWMEENKRLHKEQMNLLNDPQNQIFLSVASIWEIVIKQAKGKLKTPRDIGGGIKRSKFTMLPIETSHVLGVGKLPLHHNDPFDRLLISQAKVEKLTLITSDQKFKKYQLSLMGI